eukprot:m.150513 g.150513  ORF g.150513 m.150513 type:complete len:173 (+) comp10146_c0_seq2:1691-2209(+)
MDGSAQMPLGISCPATYGVETRNLARRLLRMALFIFVVSIVLGAVALAVALANGGAASIAVGRFIVSVAFAGIVLHAGVHGVRSGNEPYCCCPALTFFVALSSVALVFSIAAAVLATVIIAMGHNFGNDDEDAKTKDADVRGAAIALGVFFMLAVLYLVQIRFAVAFKSRLE